MFTAQLDQYVTNWNIMELTEKFCKDQTCDLEQNNLSTQQTTLYFVCIPC